MSFAQRNRRWLSVVVVVLLLLAAGSALVVAKQYSGGTNPDIPGFEDNGNEADYVALRSAAINRLRGVEPGKPFDVGKRNAAIDKMKKQKERSASVGPSAASINTTWTPVGPAPIPNGQTNNSRDPVSGRVTAIAVHPTDPNIAYVGTAQGGLFRTLDGGTTWTPLMDNAESLAIGAVTIDPLNPSTLFVGTGEGNLSGDSFFGVGLYRITNADTTPTVAGPFDARIAGTGTTSGNGHAFKGSSITRIVVDPIDDSRIFVGNTVGFAGIAGHGICCGGINPPSAQIGLYFSSNAQSATPAFSLVSTLPGNGLGGVPDVAFEPGSSDNLLVGVMDFSGGSGSGLYRTTTASTASQSPSVAPAFTRVLTPANGGNIKLAINKVASVVTVYAATEDNQGTLQVSTDGGQTFSSALTAATGFCSQQCWYDIGLAVDPTNASNVYLGGQSNSFFMSDNGGSTFTESDSRLHADVHSIAVAPSNPSIIYEGNDGGVWKSTNAGTNWTDLNNSGLDTVQFESVAAHPTDGSFIIGGTQDNGTNLRDSGGTWGQADFGDGGFALIDRSATDTTNVTMYHTYFNATNSLIGFATVDVTSNATDGNWAFRGCSGNVSHNGIICSDSVLFYAPMALGPGNPNTVYIGTSRLYRSTDKGQNNVAVSQNFGAVTISAIGISAQNDNVRIIGLSNGKVYATTTGSTTLTDVTGPIPASYVARAVIDPQNSNVAYVTLDDYGLAAGQHVWKTTNLNAATPTWALAGNGIPDVPVNAFAVDPSNSNVLYAGTDIGVYVSTDAGSSWNVLGTGLPIVAVFDMAIQPTSHTLYVATHGRGIWEISSAQPAVNLVPSALGFGDQIVNTSSAAQTVKLTNSGNAALTLSAVQITGQTADFAIGSTNTCVAVIDPGASCDTSVVFTPSTTGPRAGQLEFVDNLNQVVGTVALTGNGTAVTSTVQIAANAKEPVIAEDPANPNILVASAIDTSGAHPACGASLSIDDGGTWSTLTALASPVPSKYDSGIDPSVAFDGSGNVYLSCAFFNSTGLVAPATGSQSLDTGVYVFKGSVTGNSITWSSSPTELASAHQSTFYLFERAIFTTGTLVDKPYLAADANAANVYVSFTEQQLWGWIGRKQIVVASSTNGAQSFVTVPVDSAFGGGTSTVLAGVSSSMPVVASDGSIDVAWLLGNQIALARSGDHGGHWTKRQDVVSLTPLRAPSPNPFAFSTNSFPSLAVDPGNANHIYLAWSDNRALRAGDTPVDTNVLVLQCDFTASFACNGSGTAVVDDESSPAVDTDQLYPSIAVAPNGIVALFYYARVDTTTDQANVFVATSQNGGQSFTPNQLTGSSVHLGGPGGYVGITLDNSDVRAVWSAAVSGTQGIFEETITP